MTSRKTQKLTGTRKGSQLTAVFAVFGSRSLVSRLWCLWSSVSWSGANPRP